MGKLAINVPTVENAHEYVRQIREASLTRRVRLALTDVVEQGERYTLAGSELLSMAMARLSGIDEDQPDDATNIATLAARRLRQLEQIANDRQRGHVQLSGFPSP